MSDCINSGCGGKKDGVCMNDFPGVKCYGYEPPRKTHADRIRAMTDEELAEMIGDYIDCAICKRHAGTDACPAIESDRYGRFVDSDCYRRWLDWLRQEAET